MYGFDDSVENIFEVPKTEMKGVNEVIREA